MNKTELIEAIATRSNTTKAQTTAMLNELLEVIQQTIASGNDVQLGAFKQTTPKSHRIFFNTTADVALNQIRASQF